MTVEARMRSFIHSIDLLTAYYTLGSLLCVNEYHIEPSFSHSLPQPHPGVGIPPVTKCQKTLDLLLVLSTCLEDRDPLTAWASWFASLSQRGFVVLNLVPNVVRESFVLSSLTWHLVTCIWTRTEGQSAQEQSGDPLFWNRVTFMCT